MAAAVNITKGTSLTKDMVLVKRPALGIKPRFLDVVIGMKAKRDIKQGEPITWDMLV